jgi:hypothetical protein
MALPLPCCTSLPSQVGQLQEACTPAADLANYINEKGPGCLALVQLLLEHGADPNAQASEGLAGLTPLHIASLYRRGEARIWQSSR